MALSKPNLLPQTLTSLIALFLMLLANKMHSQGSSTEFQFDSFRLTYQGDAHVPSGSTFLRLTGTDASGAVPLAWSTGRVLYSLPVQFWGQGSQASFETTIRFLIRPSQNGAADGIAFFMAPVGTTIPRGSAAWNLGIFDSSGTSPSLFAVEFDTFSNTWDPNYRHIGIDINSINSTQVIEFDAAGQVVTAHISYNPHTHIVSVNATTAALATASISHVVDLSTILTQQVQVGISASTGRYIDVIGIHDVLSWNFTSTLVDDLSRIKNEDAHNRQYA